MDQWISKIGFPVLTVTENPNGIVVRQDRFLETGAAEPKDNETIWTVPLAILTVDENGKSEINRSAVLDKREDTFVVDTNKPFKLNAGTSGVYRVLYTPDRLAKIASEAAKEGSAFSLDDRIGLVHDSFALAKAGLADVSSALTLTDNLRHEKEYLVVSSIADNLAALVSIWWEQPEVVELLNEFRCQFFGPLVERLGYEYFDSDSADTSLLRTCAINSAAIAGDKGVVKELRSRFAHFIETGDDSKIPADLLKTTFEVGVKYGGRAEYDAMKKILEKPKTPTLGMAAMRAMGANPDPEYVNETFDYILNKSRDQDVIYYFRGLQLNFKARRDLAKFFKDNYDTLYKRFEANFTLKYLVEFSFGSLSTEKDQKEITEFFKVIIILAAFTNMLTVPNRIKTPRSIIWRCRRHWTVFVPRSRSLR
jgi:aminopeptidase 2